MSADWTAEANLSGVVRMSESAKTVVIFNSEEEESE